MARTNERHDAIRNEGEGFTLKEMDSEHFLFLFLGRVHRKFLEESNTKHIEDAVPQVLVEMTDEEKIRFIDEFGKDLGLSISENFDSRFKNFLGGEKWEELQIIERNRILAHDKHESEGVG